MMRDRPAMKLPCHDTLAKLASDDPLAFEALREELVASCIKNAPERLQRRLYGIQFRVDAIRRLSRSPLGALVKIQAMMWSSFLEMDRQLKAFSRYPAVPVGAKSPAVSEPLGGGARIIEFPRSAARNR